MTNDFYSISVLSNKLELFISRAIIYFILNGKLEVIIKTRDKDRMIIAMYVSFIKKVKQLQSQYHGSNQYYSSDFGANTEIVIINIGTVNTYIHG